MRNTLLLIVLLAITSAEAFSQSKIKSPKNEAISVYMFDATYAFQLPALDTKLDYGVNNTIGGSFGYKTDQNWLFKFNGNFIFGSKMKGDRVDILGEGITTTDGEIISGDGIFSSLLIMQRGVHFQLEAGKLFPFKPNPNSGFYVMGGLGYLSHRIRIEDQLSSTHQILDDYRFGYDRLRGGPACHLETGYMLMSDTRVYNCFVALEMTYARTKDLRDYDFRVFFDDNGNPSVVGYTDPNKRYNDLYFGIRVGWMIPTYQRQPEAYYYN